MSIQEVGRPHLLDLFSMRCRQQRALIAPGAGLWVVAVKVIPEATLEVASGCVRQWADR